MRRQVKLSPDPVDARQFEVTVKHLANSLNFGQDESVFHGGGLEYAQSRLYVAGDPVKFIDWKVSARVGKLFIKEFQEPKQFPLYLLLDTSASMCISSQPLSKYAWAVRIATGIALAAQANMTPVGLLGCGARELHVRPTLSRNLVMEWSHKLRHHDFLEETSLARRAREVAPSLKRRTMVIVLSDLHDPEAFPALQVLGQEHDCLMLHLQDPAEFNVKGAGLVPRSRGRIRPRIRRPRTPRLRRYRAVERGTHSLRHRLPAPAHRRANPRPTSPLLEPPRHGRQQREMT